LVGSIVGGVVGVGVLAGAAFVVLKRNKAEGYSAM
jgi:hypothetical protein